MQQTIASLRCDTFHCPRDITNAGKRSEQHVNVICHDAAGMQVVVPKFQRASLENQHNRTCDRGILEPKRPFSRPVEQFLGETKFFR